MHDGPDDLLLDHLDRALSTLGVLDDALRERVLDEIRTVLDDASEDRGPAIGVHVLPGGGERPEDGDERTIPALRVVDSPSPDIRVQVVRPPTRTGTPTRPRDLAHGHVRLEGGPDVWQTLLHAVRPAAYRVHCDEGELHLVVDGELVGRLEAGQSVDVEGRVLRVRACSDAPTLGRYRRVGPHAETDPTGA